MVDGHKRGTICRLTIYTRMNTKASQPVRRITWSEGIQESSRLAMLRICHIYMRELHGTVFRYHPRAAAVELPAHYPSTEGEEDATLVHLARYVVAQEESMEMMAADLDGAYKSLHQAEEKIAILEEILDAHHQADQEEEEDLEEHEESEEDPEEVEPEPEEPVAPSTPVPVAPVPGHQDQFAKMPAQFKVYSRQEHSRGCGGYLSD